MLEHASDLSRRERGEAGDIAGGILAQTPFASLADANGYFE
jgi:hypothetical protein